MNLDTQVVSGISLFFVLLFFVPLGVVATGFLFYCGLARGSVRRPAKVLSILWLMACAPASLMILMGWAFNSAKMHPLVVIPVWVGMGLAVLWIPVGLRALMGIRPV